MVSWRLLAQPGQRWWHQTGATSQDFEQAWRNLEFKNRHKEHTSAAGAGALPRQRPATCAAQRVRATCQVQRAKSLSSSHGKAMGVQKGKKIRALGSAGGF